MLALDLITTWLMSGIVETEGENKHSRVTYFNCSTSSILIQHYCLLKYNSNKPEQVMCLSVQYDSIINTSAGMSLYVP